jgi:hypothetical protein
MRSAHPGASRRTGVPEEFDVINDLIEDQEPKLLQWSDSISLSGSSGGPTNAASPSIGPGGVPSEFC